jgi:hypothetical protein
LALTKWHENKKSEGIGQNEFQESGYKQKDTTKEEINAAADV